MRIIAGRWGGRRIDAPAGDRTRPTADRVREAWMSALQPWIPGARVLDLFSGSGALGLETLSRGAEHVTFVENGSAALRVLRGNIEKLEAGAETTIVRGDALAYARTLARTSFDLALADPPYGQGLAAALIEAFAQAPFAEWLWVEHRVSDALPDVPAARTRRYGDTLLTSMQAPE